LQTQNVTRVDIWSTGKSTSQKKRCHLETTKRKGAYVLIIFVSKTLTTVVGQLGKRKFRSGYYSYAGSATGERSTDLQSRISRHLRTKETKHWHVDYLLSEKAARIVGIIVVPSDGKVECEVNQRIRDALNGKIVVPKFGASDCTNKCGSHLLYFPHCTASNFSIKEFIELLRSV
jgi:Uri superfamily endonuclease